MGAALQIAHLAAVRIGAILMRLIKSVYNVTDDSEGDSAQTLVRLAPALWSEYEHFGDGSDSVLQTIADVELRYCFRDAACRSIEVIWGHIDFFLTPDLFVVAARRLFYEVRGER